MREPGDRTAEVKAAAGNVEIARNDFCDAFEQDEGRLFSARECWYCKYGDFGIFTEHPTQNGVCRYQTTMSDILDPCQKRSVFDPTVQEGKKEEEETK